MPYDGFVWLPTKQSTGLACLLSGKNMAVWLRREAFNVKKRTLYYWKNQLKAGEGKLIALNERFRRPKHVRIRVWPWQVKQEIKRMREEHPNLGKEKIHVFLEEFCQR